MSILDMERLPAADGLADFGPEKLELLLGHYGLEREGKRALLDSDKCREEWMMLRQLVSKKLI
jgi:hypothetical protein